MPSTSPGKASSTPSSFLQVLPGAPTTSLQSLASFIFRHKRHIAYISGGQLNLLSCSNVLVQALTFDKELIAVAAEYQTGKIAVASKSDVWVLEPVTEGWTKIWWEKALYLRRQDPGDEARLLSWGSEGEVLIGGSRYMSLFSTLPSSRTSAAPPGNGDAVEERTILWSKAVPSPIQYASFSPSATLIATCGSYDRLVKIWRRLSFEEGLFDYTYLRHLGAVAHLEWRPMDDDSDEQVSISMNGRQDEDPEALYTIANDGVLRIWRTGGMHDLDILTLYTSVDLLSAIPQSPSLSVKDSPSCAPTTRPTRYTCILPSSQFRAAVNTSMGLPNTKAISHSLEHLKEVASKQPDIVVSFDGQGRMSAWGLQSIGHKRRPDTPSGSSKIAYHIAHAEGLPFVLDYGTNARFEAWLEDDSIHLLAHSFNGKIRWWKGGVESFFSPSAAGSERLHLKECWAGQTNGPIRTLKASGQGLMSMNGSGEVVHWRHSPLLGLETVSTHSSADKVVTSTLLGNANGLQDYSASLEVSSTAPLTTDLVIRNSEGLQLQRHAQNKKEIEDSEWSLQSFQGLIVGLNDKGEGFWHAVDISIPQQEEESNRLSTFSLEIPREDDPLLHTGTISNDSDKVGIIGITRSGALLLYHLSPRDFEDANPVLVAIFDSGIRDASMLAVHNDFVAITSSDTKQMTIVNLTNGYVEYQRSSKNKISHLVTAPKSNLVAVGYNTSVELLAQSRYHREGETLLWLCVKQISIAGTGLTIDSLVLLKDDSLVVAAGNGLLLSSNDVPKDSLEPDVQEAVNTGLISRNAVQLSELIRAFNNPLPVWHPSFVAHIVRDGRWALASSLVGTLLQKLKFWSEGDDLAPLLDVPADQLYGAEAIHAENNLDHEAVTELMQQLEEKDLPDVSQSEQQRLKTVLQAMIYCSEHVKGLDNAALRFLFNWRLQSLRISGQSSAGSAQPNGVVKDKTVDVPQMHWREITFAYHSTTQQPLLDVLIAHYDNKITWTIARRLGLFAWLCESGALAQIFEALAQSTYRSTDPADPINASLFFLALHKKATLIGLWRIATWHKEQRTTMNFLRRDFTQSDNRKAAKKNAYALMGKRRFEYAASFFLLAEDSTSATSVLAGQCGDVMLAIAVARIYSGDDSTCLMRLIRDRLLPDANQQGDRWLMSWCHSLLFESEQAANALVKPLDGVRMWQQDDPNTLTLYRSLRKSASEYEYEAVLRAARILRRMGLWLLALEMLSRWDFKSAQGMKPSATEPMTNGVHHETTLSAESRDEASPPPSMLDGPEPRQNDQDARAAEAAELLKSIKAKQSKTQISAIDEKKPEPTQFKEPDLNSLLDSFGL